jgi:zinc/manganese transport system ATP-binding protein
MNTQPIISLKNATLTLGKRTLWKKLNLEMQPGEFVAVLGPNGAGKSSLLKALVGMYTLNDGEAHMLGETPNIARQQVGYVPQQKSFDKDVPLSGRDLVKLGVSGTRWFLHPTTVAENKRIDAVIQEVGASNYARKPLGLLSGGEQQRLRIAQALVNNPRVLLCDEPLLSLDLASQSAVANILDERRKQGAAILFVTHEINPILPMVDRVLYLVGGKWAIGRPKEVLTSARLSQLYGVPVEVLHVHGRIIVVSAGDQTPTELQDIHHHVEPHE